jgi:hypothetical protein
MKTRYLAASALLSAAPALAQEYVMMPDSSGDKIVLFHYSDGTLFDDSFILDGAGVLYDFGTPKDAIQVGSEIWVIDQITDQIVRFDLQGNHVATLPPATAMIDNARGGCFANGTVYVTNDGSGNGATADSVVMFDTAGNRLGAVSVANSGSSPFDVVEYGGELLVTHFTSTNDTARYDFALNLLGVFHSSNGTNDVDNPEQIATLANGNVMVAGFSAPIGLYEYDSTGNLVNSILVGTGNRGVIELGNGNLMFTDGGGAKIYDVTTQQTTTVYTGSGGQFLNKLSLGPTGPVVYCTAGTSSNGCVPSIGGTGVPSASASSGFTIHVAGVEGQKQGLLFYGVNGPAATPWGIGGTSFLCVKAPTQRMGVQLTGGTAGACDGALSEDWLAFMAAHPGALGQPISAGQSIRAQAWYRDPPAVKTTNLSDGLEFTLVP